MLMRFVGYEINTIVLILLNSSLPASFCIVRLAGNLQRTMAVSLVSKIFIGRLLMHLKKGGSRITPSVRVANFSSARMRNHVSASKCLRSRDHTTRPGRLPKSCLVSTGLPPRRNDSCLYDSLITNLSYCPGIACH